MNWFSHNAIPILSDVHGNAAGLLQALDHIKLNGVSCSPLFLGDLFWTSFENRQPREVLEILLDFPVFGMVKGNTDHYLTTPGWLENWQPKGDEDKQEKNNMLVFRNSLSVSEYNFIKSMNSSLSFNFAGRKCYATHASPQNIEKGLDLQSKKEVWENRIGGVKADIIITGHLHRAFTHFAGNSIHVCVGAVGRHSNDFDGIVDYAILNETHLGLSVIHERLKQS